MRRARAITLWLGIVPDRSGQHPKRPEPLGPINGASPSIQAARFVSLSATVIPVRTDRPVE